MWCTDRENDVSVLEFGRHGCNYNSKGTCHVNCDEEVEERGT